jgi:hypothetical protein
LRCRLPVSPQRPARSPSASPQRQAGVLRAFALAPRAAVSRAIGLATNRELRENGALAADNRAGASSWVRVWSPLRSCRSGRRRAEKRSLARVRAQLQRRATWGRDD